MIPLQRPILLSTTEGILHQKQNPATFYRSSPRGDDPDTYLRAAYTMDDFRFHVSKQSMSKARYPEQAMSQRYITKCISLKAHSIVKHSKHSHQ